VKRVGAWVAWARGRVGSAWWRVTARDGAWGSVGRVGRVGELRAAREGA
jgi:hypothetical protein